MVDLDQKEEKNVEEGVEEDVFVACDNVGESIFVAFVAGILSAFEGLFNGGTEESNPFEEEIEISESCDALRETALEVLECACAGVEVVIDIS